MPTPTNPVAVIRGVTSVWFLVAGFLIGKDEIMDGALVFAGIVMIAVYWFCVWIGEPNE